MKIPAVPPQFPLSGMPNELGNDRLMRIMAHSTSPVINRRYLHWDKLRHREPPAGLSSEEHWFAVKIARRVLYEQLPLHDGKGVPFVYALVSPTVELLHEIDKYAGGTIGAPEQVTNPATRDRYLVSSLIEESITSSQLEGASTTRAAAIAMLREGRAPRDIGERMIVNNYAAMEWLRARQKSPLTPEIVLQLHRILTEGTLDDPASAGKLRSDADEIVVSDEVGKILHAPPSASELPRRLTKLCEFANGEGMREFLHPVLRAIILHFWLAYDHPFVDGNGRTARALFYWSMARSGYWLCEFVSISRILKRARADYLRSFLYCETDDNDMTYFLLNQLRVLVRGIADLHVYLAKKAEQMRNAERVLRRAWKTKLVLNERQLALLAHALRTPNASYTVESHRRSHAVTYETARTDLLALANDDLLLKRKRARAFVFVPTERLAERAG